MLGIPLVFSGVGCCLMYKIRLNTPDLNKSKRIFWMKTMLAFIFLLEIAVLFLMENKMSSFVYYMFLGSMAYVQFILMGQIIFGEKGEAA